MRSTIEEATNAFLRDAEARGLREPSIYKYRLLFKQLRAFAEDKGLRYITECDIETLRTFRESWVNKNLQREEETGSDANLLSTSSTSLAGFPPIPPRSSSRRRWTTRLRCHIPRTCCPASYHACDQYPDRKHAIKLRALTLLLRYSGLRGTDAVTLTKHSVQGGVLVLRTAKTGTDVRVPLPQIALDALAAIPTDNYYFWSGHGTKKSCVGDYQRAFKKLYEIAGVENGHMHRWRDTFAVELLLAGVPLEQVSVLLGTPVH